MAEPTLHTRPTGGAPDADSRGSEPPTETALDVEVSVRERYAAAAQVREASLCCPVDYDPRFLEVIPEDVLERDYGCGDPSRYVHEGDTVLDLGSGGGKIAFIAQQKVGPTGRVLGVDTNDEMLSLAREAAPVVAERLGYSNVDFLRGRIQDLALDVEALDRWLAGSPVRSSADVAELEAEQARLRRERPLVADATIDLVVSNCVLNLVREDHKQALIDEIFRVLKVGGRIAISDIVSDEPVPQVLKDDPELWSGCVSGAFQEGPLLAAFEQAGFHGIAIDQWADEPFAVVGGIEFRSVTITAHKGKQGACDEANQAVLYAGPWKRVEDDDGHVFERGVRTAVSAKTFGLLTRAPYAGQTIGIEPHVAIAADQRAPFDCQRSGPRHPSESKGPDSRETHGAAAGESCC